MANNFEVTCVTKNEQAQPTERVTHIGGINGRGRGWRLTRAEAIEGIISGRWQFFVRVGEAKTTLVVGMSAMGARYLKTELDDGDPRTLLQLPECDGMGG
jgi:hypothetical protein